MKKTITIHGVTYTQKQFAPVYNSNTSIFELYAKPSQEKIKIFFDWQKKLNNIYGLIGGHQNFSIYGNIIDEAGQVHNVKITKSYNYILD